MFVCPRPSSDYRPTLAKQIVTTCRSWLTVSAAEQYCTSSGFNRLCSSWISTIMGVCPSVRLPQLSSMQIASLLRRIKMPVACLVAQYFPHYFITGTTFGKILLNIKCEFLFSLQLFFLKNLILRRIQRDITKRTQVFTWRSRYSCRNLIKLEFSRWIFKKSSNIKFHENPSSGSRVVPCRRTDGQTDMTKV
jgi:hypothetical protein